MEFEQRIHSVFLHVDDIVPAFRQTQSTEHFEKLWKTDMYRAYVSVLHFIEQ